MILSGITSIAQHISTLNKQPELYRPSQCPHCGDASLNAHGYYNRKPDRHYPANKSLNPVRIPRFLCRQCRRSCSTLPECIPPRRWYLWRWQQIVLLLLVNGQTLAYASRKGAMHRKTIRRWKQRLIDRFQLHADSLKALLPTLGRCAGFTSFWQSCLQLMPLSEAMISVQKAGISIP